MTLLTFLTSYEEQGTSIDLQLALTSKGQHDLERCSSTYIVKKYRYFKGLTPKVTLTYIYHFLTSPSSHPKTLVQGYWSPETYSVHITDTASTRLLWEQGFFGKGSLSRSEPTWLDREKRRQGFRANETSEEYTRLRREERKQMKRERAKKEQEAIDEKLWEEMLAKQFGATGTVPTARSSYENRRNDETLLNGTAHEPKPSETMKYSPEDAAPATDESRTHFMAEFAPEPSPPSIDLSAARTTSQANAAEPPSIHDQEHHQLTPEEAFFLTYALDILIVYPSIKSNIAPLLPATLLTLFLHNTPTKHTPIQPDDPFLLSYCTYHHFRSLGWVVRPGMKFAVDHLLYLRGPVFSHAEFAVIVLPAYTHPYWRSTEELKGMVARKEKKTWWWLHCVNRVLSRVRKGLVVAWVDVPPLGVIEGFLGNGADGGREVTDIGKMFKQYKVREMVFKRWIPNRSRD